MATKYPVEITLAANGEAAPSSDRARPGSANDNAGTPVIRAVDVAGSDDSGRAWDPGAIEVQALIGDVDRDLLTYWKPTEVGLLAYLRELASSTGELPTFRGKPSPSYIARAAGLHPLALLPCKPAGMLLARYAARFRLVEPAKIDPSGEPVAPSIAAAVGELIDRCARENVPIPASPDGKRIDWHGVAAMMGREHAEIRRQSKARAMVRTALREGRVRLDAIALPENGLATAENERRTAELYRVVDGFDVPGGKVPEHRSGRGHIDFDYIASLAGVPGSNGKHDNKYVAHVKAIAARRGTLMPGLMTTEDTLARLRIWGLERVADDRRASGLSDPAAVVAAHRSAFDRFVAKAGLTPEDLASDAFGERYEDLRASMIAGYDKPQSARNLGNLLDAWRTMHLARLGAAELPEAFGEAVRALMDRRCVSIAATARQCGLEPALLGNWTRETSGPSSGDMDGIRAMEDLFGLPRGTLLHKLGRTVIRKEKVRDATSQWRALSSEIRALLPVEASRWSAEKLAHAVTQVEPLLGAGTSFTPVIRAAREERFRYPVVDLPAQVLARREAYVEYKTSATAYPLLRARNARWTSEVSESLRMQGVDNLFRFVLSPLSDEPNGGLGVPVETATYAWLAHAPFSLAYTASRTRRFADIEHNGEVRGVMYTAAETNFLSHLVGMTNPVNGWLAQHPELADELVPLRQGLPDKYDSLLAMFGGRHGGGLLTEGDVAEAKRDWVGWVGRAHRAYVDALSYAEDAAEVSRNPVECVDGLIRSGEPIYNFLALAFEAERRWSPEVTSPKSYRVDVRNSVLARLCPITGFRPSNTLSLDFTGDHRGRIRKLDGVWQIEVPYKEFKNFKSCRLFGPKTGRRNYRLDLVDEAGLYDLLDLWFYDCLPALKGDYEDNAAFRARTGSPLDQASFNKAFRVWGARHVAWNPVLRTGFPGVTSLNPYVVRHLRATDTLMNGVSHNRVEEASFAIQTSERMIRDHYGSLIPEQALEQSYQTFSKAALKAWKGRG